MSSSSTEEVSHRISESLAPTPSVRDRSSALHIATSPPASPIAPPTTAAGEEEATPSRVQRVVSPTMRDRQKLLFGGAGGSGSPSGAKSPSHRRSRTGQAKSAAMLERQKKLFGGLGSPFGGLGAVSESETADDAGGADVSVSSPSPRTKHKRAATGFASAPSSPGASSFMANRQKLLGGLGGGIPLGGFAGGGGAHARSHIKQLIRSKTMQMPASAPNSPMSHPQMARPRGPSSMKRPRRVPTATLKSKSSVWREEAEKSTSDLLKSASFVFDDTSSAKTQAGEGEKAAGEAIASKAEIDKFLNDGEAGDRAKAADSSDGEDGDVPEVLAYESDSDDSDSDSVMSPRGSMRSSSSSSSRSRQNSVRPHGVRMPTKALRRPDPAKSKQRAQMLPTASSSNRRALPTSPYSSPAGGEDAKSSKPTPESSKLKPTESASELLSRSMLMSGRTRSTAFSNRKNPAHAPSSNSNLSHTDSSPMLSPKASSSKSPDSGDTPSSAAVDMTKYVLASELEDARKKLAEDTKRLEDELRKAKFAHSDEMSKVVSKWEDTVKAEKEQHKEELESLRNELMFEEHEHKAAKQTIKRIRTKHATEIKALKSSSSSDQTENPEQSLSESSSKREAELLQKISVLERQVQKAEFAHAEELSGVVSKWEDTVKSEKEQSRKQIQLLKDMLQAEEMENEAACAKFKRRLAAQASKLKDALDKAAALESQPQAAPTSSAAGSTKELEDEVNALKNALQKADFAHSEEMARVVSKWEDTVRAEKEQSKKEIQSLRDSVQFEEMEFKAAAAKSKRQYALQASNLKDALEKVSALQAKVEELEAASTQPSEEAAAEDAPKDDEKEEEEITEGERELLEAITNLNEQHAQEKELHAQEIAGFEESLRRRELAHSEKLAQVVTKWEDTLSAEKQQRDEEIRKLRADLEFTEAEAESAASSAKRRDAAQASKLKDLLEKISTLEEDVGAAKAEAAEAASRVAEREAKHAKEMDLIRSQHEEAMQKADAKHSQELADAALAREEALEEADAKHQQELVDAELAHEEAVEEAGAKHSQELADAVLAHKKAFKAEKDKHLSEVASLREQMEVLASKTDAADLVKELEAKHAEEVEKIKLEFEEALEKANATHVDESAVAAKNSESALKAERERHLAEMSALREELQAQTEKYTASIAELDTISAGQSESLNKAQSELEAKIKSIEASFAEEKQAQVDEIASLREQLKSAPSAGEVSALQAERDGLTAKNSTLQERVRELEQTASSHADALKNAKNDAEAKIKSLEASLATAKKARDEEKHSLPDQAKLTSETEEVSALIAERDDLTARNLALERRVKSDAAKAKRSKDTLKGVIARRDKTIRHLRDRIVASGGPLEESQFMLSPPNSPPMSPRTSTSAEPGAVVSPRNDDRLARLADGVSHLESQQTELQKSVEHEAQTLASASEILDDTAASHARSEALVDDSRKQSEAASAALSALENKIAALKLKNAKLVLDAKKSEELAATNSSKSDDAIALLREEMDALKKRALELTAELDKSREEARASSSEAQKQLEAMTARHSEKQAEVEATQTQSEELAQKVDVLKSELDVAQRERTAMQREVASVRALRSDGRELLERFSSFMERLGDSEEKL